jgi:hypothetical protein
MAANGGREPDLHKTARVSLHRALLQARSFADERRIANFDLKGSSLAAIVPRLKNSSLAAAQNFIRYEPAPPPLGGVCKGKSKSPNQTPYQGCARKLFDWSVEAKAHSIL